jgi:capsular exopolysaccharide synthesis family protein
MELQIYLKILWRRKWLILLVTLLVTGAAVVYTYLATPMYVSTTTLRVVTIGSELGGRPDTNYTQLLMSTYSSIVSGATVRAEVMERLNLQEQPSTTVSLVRGTELMRIQVEAADPTVAQEVASATAAVVIRESQQQFTGGGQTMQEILQRQLEQVDQELTAVRDAYDRLVNDSATTDSQLNAAQQSIALKERTYATLLEQYETARVNEALRANAVYIVEPATLPRRPASPRADANLILGLLMGLFSGIGVAFLVENLDKRLYSSEQIEAATQVNIIGEIPRSKEPLRIMHSNNGHRPQIEAFRRLRVNVLVPHAEVPAKVILVTSANEGEGKSTVVANLGVTMAQSGRRVILVDCNIHQPSLHQFFDLPNEVGLTEILMGQSTVTGTIQPTQTARLSIIASGRYLLSTPNGPHSLLPAAFVDRLNQGTDLLGSPTMVAILKQLREEYDIVLIDTPGLKNITDAMVLAPLVDEVVFVVARQQAQRDTLHGALRQLRNVESSAIGLVVN